MLEAVDQCHRKQILVFAKEIHLFLALSLCGRMELDRRGSLRHYLDDTRVPLRYCYLSIALSMVRIKAGQEEKGVSKILRVRVGVGRDPGLLGGSARWSTRFHQAFQ